MYLCTKLSYNKETVAGDRRPNNENLDSYSIIPPSIPPKGGINIIDVYNRKYGH